MRSSIAQQYLAALKGQERVKARRNLLAKAARAQSCNTTLSAGARPPSGLQKRAAHGNALSDLIHACVCVAYRRCVQTHAFQCGADVRKRICALRSSGAAAGCTAARDSGARCIQKAFPTLQRHLIDAAACQTHCTPSRVQGAVALTSAASSMPRSHDTASRTGCSHGNHLGRVQVDCVSLVIKSGACLGILHAPVPGVLVC